MDQPNSAPNVELSGLRLTDHRDTYYDKNHGTIPARVEENDSELVSQTQNQDRPEHGQPQNQTQNPGGLLTATAPFRGRGIPTLEDPPRPAKRSVVSDLGTELRVTVRKRTDSSTLSYDSKTGALDTALDRAIVDSAVSKLGFIPDGQLPKLINQDAVTLELKKCRDSIRKRIRTYNFKEPKLTDDEITKLAAKICGASEERKSYRKILAILLLIDRPSRITHFVDEGVSDQDLPLEIVETLSTRPLRRRSFDLRRRGDPLAKPLRCFMCPRKWRKSTVERFEKYQWSLLAPFLSQDGPRLFRFKIPDKAILPFERWERIGQQGGFSHVYEAEIHPDHHGFHVQDLDAQDGRGDHGHETTTNPPSTRSNVFAVKRLKTQNRDDFLHEFDMHKRVSKNLHQHLIPLLAAYEQHGIYHLIFPLAGADLEKYWRNKEQETNQEAARWVAEQCQGLAGAVAAIHRSYTLSDSLSFRALPGGQSEGETQGVNMSQTNGPPTSIPRQRFAGHCRHGDIKPKNILWFPDGSRQQKETTPRGTLRITDFGAAQYAEHRVPTSGSQNTPIYRPPEADLTAQGTEPDVIVGTSYDIWSLGCVFLEFVAWFLDGWHGVQIFLENRSTVDRACHNFHTGKFFLIESGDAGKTSRARVKPEVDQFIHDAQSKPSTSDFFHDFLSLVRDEMLVIEEDVPGSPRRSSAANIETKLADLVRKGRNSPGYFHTRSQCTNGHHSLKDGILSVGIDMDRAPRIHLHEVAQ